MVENGLNGDCLLLNDGCSTRACSAFKRCFCFNRCSRIIWKIGVFYQPKICQFLHYIQTQYFANKSMFDNNLIRCFPWFIVRHVVAIFFPARSLPTLFNLKFTTIYSQLLINSWFLNKNNIVLDWQSYRPKFVEFLSPTHTHTQSECAFQSNNNIFFVQSIAAVIATSIVMLCASHLTIHNFWYIHTHVSIVLCLDISIWSMLA